MLVFDVHMQFPAASQPYIGWFRDINNDTDTIGAMAITSYARVLMIPGSQASLPSLFSFLMTTLFLCLSLLFLFLLRSPLNTTVFRQFQISILI